MLGGPVTVSGAGHFLSKIPISEGKPVAHSYLASNITQVAVISGWNGSYGSMRPGGHITHLAAVIGGIPDAQWVQNSRWRRSFLA